MQSHNPNTHPLYSGVVWFLWNAAESAHTLGQLVSIDYSDSTPDVAFTYDRLGRQLTITDVLGTRTNVYDALNLLEERHPDGTALVRTYDAYGRASGIALDPDYSVGYGYDSFGRFSTVAVTNGATFTYSYVPDSSLLAGYTNDLGLSVAYEYEPHRDLKTLVFNAWSTNPISTFAYTYDAIDRRIQRVDSGLTTNVFAYNTRSELINAVMGTNTYSYAYDPIGNRTSTSENGTTTTYAANSLNQYTALNPSSTNPTPFTYDPDGNMTSDGIWSYDWDAENRLIEVQPLVTNLGSTLVQYMYDAQSRRIARREFSWMAFLHDDPTWRYVQGRAYRYDGWNLLHELKPPATPRTPPTYIPQTNLYLTGTTGPVAAAYVWGLDLSATLQDAGGIGGLLMQRHSDPNSPWFSFCDANGNISDLLYEDGTLAAHYEYDSYGTINSMCGGEPETNSFRFGSKYFDELADLYYYGYRFYDPKIGRWISRDPLSELGGINRYGFCGNNSLNSWDMHGLASNNLDGWRDLLEAIQKAKTQCKCCEKIMKYLHCMEDNTLSQNEKLVEILDEVADKLRMLDASVDIIENGTDLAEALLDMAGRENDSQAIAMVGDYIESSSTFLHKLSFLASLGASASRKDALDLLLTIGEEAAPQGVAQFLSYYLDSYRTAVAVISKLPSRGNAASKIRAGAEICSFSGDCFSAISSMGGGYQDPWHCSDHLR